MKVLILGGSTDIGISLAKYFQNLGNTVIVTYNTHKCNIDDIECLHLDIRDENEIESTIKYVINKYGKIDLLINMAAVSYDNLFLDNTKEEFMNALEVNLVGPFLASKIYSKYIDDGIILNIASTDGIDTYSKYSMLYSASKAGVINMSRSMALGTNNKVLCICPNWIDSDSTREMDSTYLNSELKRIKQDRLITLDEFNEAVNKVINNYQSGDVIRIDIKGDKLWIAKIL